MKGQEENNTSSREKELFVKMAIDAWETQNSRVDKLLEDFSDEQKMIAQMVEDFMQMAGLMTVFFVVASVLVWLLKTVLEYRRWLRLTKLQAEVHGKLLDRFTASEELLAYIKSPSGQRFLDAAPLALDQPAARMSAPVNRILWSLQAGFVLACAGGGLIFVSRRITQDEINQFVSVIGVVVLAIGVGFILSAAGAWLLSKRLGLLSREGRSSDDATAFGPAA